MNARACANATAIIRWLTVPFHTELEDEIVATFGSGDVLPYAYAMKQVVHCDEFLTGSGKIAYITDATLANYIEHRVDDLVNRSLVMLYRFNDRKTVPRGFYTWIEHLVHAIVVKVASPEGVRFNNDPSYEALRRSKICGLIVDAFAKNFYYPGMDGVYAGWYLLGNSVWDSSVEKEIADDGAVTRNSSVHPPHWAANFFLECVRRSDCDSLGRKRWGEASIYIRKNVHLLKLTNDELKRHEEISSGNYDEDEDGVRLENMSDVSVTWLKRITKGGWKTDNIGVSSAYPLAICDADRLNKRKREDV